MRRPCRGREGKYSAISRHLPLEDRMREDAPSPLPSAADLTVTWTPEGCCQWPFQNKLRPWLETPEQRALGEGTMKGGSPQVGGV